LGEGGRGRGWGKKERRGRKINKRIRRKREKIKALKPTKKSKREIDMLVHRLYNFKIAWSKSVVKNLKDNQKV